MYNRYIPDGNSYTRILEDDESPIQPPRSPQPPPPDPPPAKPEPHPRPDPSDPQPEKKAGLSAILKGLKLDDLDTGDILLLLIILFLFLEGDDMELIITLGLMLLLGLD